MRASLTLALVCAVGCARSGSTALNLGAMPAGVSMDAQVHYYDVSAASLAELRRGMITLGPRWEGRAFSAVTQTNFRWVFQYERQGIGCELRRVRVQLRTTVTFPRWNPTAEPDSSMLEWWRQLNAGLMEHERGHALISVRTAGDIVRELEGMSGTRCEPLSALANAAGSRILRANQETQLDYDRSTRHGASQIEQAGRLRSP